MRLPAVRRAGQRIARSLLPWRCDSASSLPGPVPLRLRSGPPTGRSQRAGSSPSVGFGRVAEFGIDQSERCGTCSITLARERVDDLELVAVGVQYVVRGGVGKSSSASRAAPITLASRFVHHQTFTDINRGGNSIRSSRAGTQCPSAVSPSSRSVEGLRNSSPRRT